MKYAGSIAGTVLVVGSYAAVVPALRYRIHRWEITHEAVYTLSGWLVREWRIAPISRVQTVDTERGPLQQLLKLADLTVTTASARGPVKIVGLDEHQATELARTMVDLGTDAGWVPTLRSAGVDPTAAAVVAVARELGVPEDQLSSIRQAAELHDIGKVAIPDAILHKPGALDDDEWAFVRQHTIIGERIVSAAP